MKFVLKHVSLRETMWEYVEMALWGDSTNASDREREDREIDERRSGKEAEREKKKEREKERRTETKS